MCSTKGKSYSFRMAWRWDKMFIFLDELSNRYSFYLILQWLYSIYCIYLSIQLVILWMCTTTNSIACPHFEVGLCQNLLVMHNLEFLHKWMLCSSVSADLLLVSTWFLSIFATQILKECYLLIGQYSYLQRHWSDPITLSLNSHKGFTV